MLLKLAFKSLLNRKVTLCLTVLSIAVSVFVLLGVEHIRQEARGSFGRTVSDVDLIVGARTSPLNLLLYSVFRIGNATSDISWQSYQEIAAEPRVAWSVPIALGDSHRGFRVMGTTQDYFEYFRYGHKQALRFAEGGAFEQVYDVVLGSEVAQRLKYPLGEQLVLSHGLGSTSFSRHEDKPFQVTGILAPTGTPVDQALYVRLGGIEAIHRGWQKGMRRPSAPAGIAGQDLTPRRITAFLLGLDSKIDTFALQRKVNGYAGEPLLAIVPGVALAELWQMMGTLEQLLLLIAALVLMSALLGMVTMLLASMRERLREMAVLRAMGASPWFIFLLLEAEALLIALLGAATAFFVLWAVLVLGQDLISARYGLFVSAHLWSASTATLLAITLAASFAVGLLPALGAYRACLHAGLSNRN